MIARPVVSEADGLLVPVEVSLLHRPTDTFNVSVGAATDTGPRVRLGWERPWVNSKGHSVSSDVFISAPEQSVTADYRIPMRNITRDYASIEAGYQFIEYSNTSFESETLSLSAHRYWQQDGSPWQQDYSLTYLRETYDQGELEANTTSLVLPGYSLTYSKKDSELNISNGNYFQVLAQYGKEGLGSDIDYIKTVVELKQILLMMYPHHCGFTPVEIKALEGLAFVTYHPKQSSSTQRLVSYTLSLLVVSTWPHQALNTHTRLLITGE